MPQNIGTGWNSYVNYGFEASYGAGAVSNRTFGHGTKITTSRKNNIERIWGLGDRNAVDAVAKKYEGTVSIEFILSNASFFRAVFGQVADAGSSPYTHTYTETDVLPSFAIDTGTELGTNDEVVELKGVKINSMSLTAAVDELVKVRLEGLYQTETLATSGIGSQVAETFDVYSFSQGELELPNGTTIGKVQSFELTNNQTLEQIWDLASRFPSTSPAKKREYNIKMTVIFTDVTILFTKFLGGSSAPVNATPAAVADLILTFSNGLSGADERSIVLTLNNIYLDEETLPKEPGEIIKEDVTGFALSGASVVWTNNTAVDAGNP